MDYIHLQIILIFLQYGNFPLGLTSIQLDFMDQYEPDYGAMLARHEHANRIGLSLAGENVQNYSNTQNISQDPNDFNVSNPDIPEQDASRADPSHMAFLNEMMGLMDINHDIQPQNIHTEPNLVPPNFSNTSSNQAYNPYGGSGTNQNIGYQSNFNPAPAAQNTDIYGGSMQGQNMDPSGSSMQGQNMDPYGRSNPAYNSNAFQAPMTSQERPHQDMKYYDINQHPEFSNQNYTLTKY